MRFCLKKYFYYMFAPLPSAVGASSRYYLFLWASRGRFLCGSAAVASPPHTPRSAAWCVRLRCSKWRSASLCCAAPCEAASADLECLR